MTIKHPARRGELAQQLTAATTITGAWRFETQVTLGVGANLYIYDSTDGDWLRLYHTGSQAIISTGGTAGGALQFNAANGFCDFSTGQTVRIRDSDNDSYLDQSADGTDFNFVFTSTTDWNISGANVKFVNDVGFYNTAPVAQQTGVAVTAAGIHAALVNLGLITA